MNIVINIGYSLLAYNLQCLIIWQQKTLQSVLLQTKALRK